MRPLDNGVNVDNVVLPMPPNTKPRSYARESIKMLLLPEEKKLIESAAKKLGHGAFAAHWARIVLLKEAARVLG